MDWGGNQQVWGLLECHSKSPAWGPPAWVGLARTRLGTVGLAAAMAETEPEQALKDKAVKGLVSLMGCEEIPVNIQLKLYEAGLTSVARFASVAKDQEDLRALLATVGVEPPDRVETTKLAVLGGRRWRGRRRSGGRGQG